MKRFLIFILAAASLAGCSGGKKADLGPKETLQMFYEHICSGEFSEAQTLCDNTSMSEYIETFSSAWAKTDPAISAIASDILSDLTIKITEEQKNGQTRTIFYELTVSDSQNKEKIATLRKEEGAWKIEAITDRH